jgi:hypothetical protein
VSASGDIASLFGRNYETIHNDEEIAKREGFERSRLG